MKSIDDAIAKKEFSKATTYQAELEKLESLRPTLPSLEEIEAELKGLKAEMEEAIQQKNFKKADSLTKNIDKVKVNLEEERGKMPSNCEMETSEKPLSQFTNERGERITFESRYKLEEDIIWFKTLVKCCQCEEVQGSRRKSKKP